MSLAPQHVGRQPEHLGSDPTSPRFVDAPNQKKVTGKKSDSGARINTGLPQDDQELRQIVELIPQAIIVLNPDGKAVYANRVALEYTGLTLGEVLESNFRDRCFHPQDIQRLQEIREKALSGTSPFENEQRVRRKDGRFRWFLIQYSPLLDDNRKVVRWYATGTDIEDRKLTETLLESERDRLRLLVEVQKALVTNLDLRGLLTGLAASLRRVTECDFVGLALPEPSGEALRLHFAHYFNGPRTFKEGMTAPLHGSASGKAFRTRQLVCLNNVKADQPDTEIYGTPEGQEFYQLLL